MIDRAAAAAALERIRGCRVAVVGDVMLDQYVYGDSQRLSPEAPVPVVRIEREVDAPGGAANVAANLKALGAEPWLVGVVGDDPAADRLSAALEAAGLDAGGLVVEPGRATGTKMRVVCRGQQVVRVDRETSAPITQNAAEQVLDELGRADGACAWIFSDYGKGVLDPRHLPRMVAAAPEGLYTCVDPVPFHVAAYQGIRAATPNEREARRTLNLPPWERLDGPELARRVHDRFGFPELFLTLGAQGMVWIDETNEPVHVPTRARQVFDVSGAGDTVVAVVATLRGLGIATAEAVALANLAAGLVVEKVGTATVTPDELLAEL